MALRLTDWGDRGTARGQTYRHMCREAEIKQAMSTDGDIPSASWKLSLLILYIWIQEVGLLDTAEQAGLTNIPRDLCMGTVWGWKHPRGRRCVWHFLLILYIYTGTRGMLPVFPEPDHGKSLSFRRVWSIGVLDVAMLMSTTPIHSGLHWIIHSPRDSSTPISHNTIYLCKAWYSHITILGSRY